MSLKFDMEHGVRHGNDNFHCKLIRLMRESDPQNYDRLAEAFPNTAEVVQAWLDGKEIPDLDYE